MCNKFSKTKNIFRTTFFETFVTLILLLVSGTFIALLSPEPKKGLFPTNSPEPSLLLHLIGNHGFKVDFSAGGQVDPNFLRSFEIVPDGAVGSAFEAGDDQLMSYGAQLSSAD